MEIKTYYSDGSEREVIEGSILGRRKDLPIVKAGGLVLEIAEIMPLGYVVGFNAYVEMEPLRESA